MTTFFSFTPVPLSSGVVANICGGLSSYHPPSGCPILAHPAIIIMMTSGNMYLKSFNVSIIYSSPTAAQYARASC